jgi:hypothetical protein
MLLHVDAQSVSPYAMSDTVETTFFGQWSIAEVDLAIMLNRLVLNDDEVPSTRFATEDCGPT